MAVTSAPHTHAEKHRRSEIPVAERRKVSTRFDGAVYRVKQPTVKTLDPFPAFVPLAANIEHAETEEDVSTSGHVLKADVCMTVTRRLTSIRKMCLVSFQ